MGFDGTLDNYEKCLGVLMEFAVEISLNLICLHGICVYIIVNIINSA